MTTLDSRQAAGLLSLLMASRHLDLEDIMDMTREEIVAVKRLLDRTLDELPPDEVRRRVERDLTEAGR